MARHLPPSKRYRKTKVSVDNTYTEWGWDRLSDKAYVDAIWQLGLNRKVCHLSNSVLTSGSSEIISRRIGILTWLSKLARGLNWKLSRKH